ncbi:MAG: phosphoesterase, partial [Alkalinema sp. RL_2_19]|nr:phosphoesterase [Alkalinema sp. RL_2_19]
RNCRLDQLSTDLKTGKLPNYSHIILNQCNEMHGLQECPNDEKLIQRGDAAIGQLVDRITSATVWSAAENSAIVVTFDEDNYYLFDHPEEQGCCGTDPKSETHYGGGHIATIVITNHGPRGLVDATPYNHYSLLRTTENAFGIDEYLNMAGATDQGVQAMTKLFAVPITPVNPIGSTVSNAN